MNLFRISILIFCLFLFNKRCIAQSGILDSFMHATVEAGTILSSDSRVPFWLRTNQYGIIPNRAPAGIIQVNLFKDYKKQDSLSTKRRFDWGFVVNPVVTYEGENKFKVLFPEAHVKVRFKKIEFYAGRRRELMGLGDSTLSSGFYAVSGNAMPIPKIQLGTVGYVPVAFRKFLAINAGFAHGWINTPPYISGARLHQKYFYFRLGQPASKTKFYIGINHQAMWAGHSEYLRQNPNLAINGQLPDSWKLYQFVVLGYTPKNWFQKAGYTSFDSYRIGNHVGSYDAAIETRLNGNRLLFYYQHTYEDVSSLLFKNFPDGLWGANWVLNDNVRSKNFRLTRLTLEHLTTKDQSGAQFYIPGSIYQGADNYFNHSQYTEGWSYSGSTIGTPFIAPTTTLDHSKPMAPRFFPNNLISMWYAGAQGKYNTLLLTIRVSYSSNFGIPDQRFSPGRNQFSSLFSAQLPIRQWHNTNVIARFSLDKGDLFPKTYGGYLGLKRTW